MDSGKLYDGLTGLPAKDLASLAAAVVPAEVRPHMPTDKATQAEWALWLTKLADQSPAVATQLERRLTDPVAEWREWGARHYGWVRVVGFQNELKIELSLRDTFVPLSLQPRGRGETPEEMKAGRALHAEEPQRVCIKKALTFASELKDTAGIVLLGDPGAGKTTLLHHLYTRVATDGSVSMGLPEGLCPVYIRCSSITDGDRTGRGLAGVILRQAAVDGYPDAGSRVVDERRKVLFLLDGLDEVRDKSTRARVCEWLGKEVAHWPGSCFVVTCRLQAFRDEARLNTHFLRVDVEWLDAPRVHDFVHRWFRAVDERLHAGQKPAEQAAEQAEALLRVALDPARMQNVRLREMTQNPLLLSTLCLVHYKNLRLPEKRGELYDHCISLLLQTWAADAGRPTLPDKPTRLVLQPLAHTMHTRSVRELSADEAQALVDGPLRQVPSIRRSPAEFLELACEQCGVLASKNIGSYEFFHLSFQEYLCAAHMKEAGLAAELARRAGDPWWHEVVLLAMSMPGMFAPFVRAMIQRGDLAKHAALVRDCLDETIQLDESPFVEVLDGAIERLARPKRGPWAMVARWFDGPELDVTTTVRAVLEIAQGRALAGVIERAAKLEGHLDPTVAAAASALTRKLAVEQAKVPGPTAAVWRELLTGMSFVLVPSGRLVMGSSKKPGTPGFDPEACDDETPAHEVELPHGVWMGEHPVTNAAYAVFLAERKHPEPAFWQNRRFNAAEQPVVGVSFVDAVAFCAWLNERLKLGHNHRFDLPTEAEWEHAARGSDGRKYPWGNECPSPDLACFNQPWESGAPAFVGGRPAGKSPFGCQDMVGNVWEWCLDAWCESYDNKMTMSVNPCHPGDRDSPRVIRGGSWDFQPTFLRCAIRFRNHPAFRHLNLGFRVVCRGSRQPWLVGS